MGIERGCSEMREGTLSQRINKDKPDFTASAVETKEEFSIGSQWAVHYTSEETISVSPGQILRALTNHFKMFYSEEKMNSLGYLRSSFPHPTPQKRKKVLMSP